LFRRGNSPQSHRGGQTECENGEGSLAASLWKRSEREYFQGFFIRIGARYRRIRKRPKGKPSPPLYAYKTEKLQELEQQATDGFIDLYFGDESHICSEGYVPYGWQFRGEDVFIPSQKGMRLNIFGMIDRNNRYDGFSTTESITADKVADFLDRLSFRIRKNTFVVLDNAKVHRCKLIAELRPAWKKRGLFLFFLPPYSPHLNIAETLWRILKGKWLRPADYFSTDSLLYATNRALAAVGNELYIKFAHAA
jgi:transposase